MPEGLRFNTSLCSESEGIPKQSSFPRKILEKISAFHLASTCTLIKQANPDKSEWITRTHSLNENRYTHDVIPALISD
jgi:hypothetical protein